MVNRKGSQSDAYANASSGRNNVLSEDEGRGGKEGQWPRAILMHNRFNVRRMGWRSRGIASMMTY